MSNGSAIASAGDAGILQRLPDWVLCPACQEAPGKLPPARWQSGHAAACKAVDAGSIPTLASISLCRAVRMVCSRVETTLCLRAKLEQLAGLAVERDADRLERREADRFCLAGLEDRQVGDRDVDA